MHSLMQQNGGGQSLESEPFLPLEYQIWKRACEQHQENRKRITELPVKFRHTLEIHAIDRRHQSWRHEYDCGNRKDLDDIVLLDGDDAKHRIEQEGDLSGKISRMVGKRLHVALHAPKVGARILRPAHAVRLIGEIE